jgi:DNA invertase Pin-like site-specific DNA recombinase
MVSITRRLSPLITPVNSRARSAGCEKVFAEQVSSIAEREQLAAALGYAREGDILLVTKLDRLARSVSHLVAIGERLEGKRVALKDWTKPLTRPTLPDA